MGRTVLRDGRYWRSESTLRHAKGAAAVNARDATSMIRCYSCGGMTEPGLVADLYAAHGIYVAVENVPADVCRQCGSLM